MADEIIKKIELTKFNNEVALQMGLAIVEFAKKQNQHIAISVERLHYTVFLFVDDTLCSDNLNWLRRKANVAKRFEESSLRVKHDLTNGNMTLKETFALNPKDFLAKGGAIPIFVKDAGMIAFISVSGLKDEEDHKIIVDALKGKCIN
ncbi:heme-binding protein [Tenacibaculum tangerinum]|uniref:Heme-binding protein n=1 Tax=Tenacibaculum tangerinum TaxID=3038772 RepID=A0ABY8L451_9FLAO|nr:heme-binding protein [Tenacibaculum tangerinum]WGH76165.1 heme-binding protein [Tenacibaculum tangerinum]